MARASSRAGTTPKAKKTAKKKTARKAVKKAAPKNDKAIATKRANAKKAAAAKKAARAAKPKKKAAKKTKRPTVKDKRPARQEAFLELAKAENPGITSDELAVKYNIAQEDVMKFRLFIHEYLKDFNETKACLRMGYDLNSAKAAAKMLFLHSFTQLRLTEVMSELEAESIVSGAEIMLGLKKEACLGEDDSNSSGRIAAWKELARIKRMGVAASNKPQLVQGVMLVPMIVSETPVKSWEDKAKASQAALKEGSIEV